MPTKKETVGMQVAAVAECLPRLRLPATRPSTLRFKECRHISKWSSPDPFVKPNILRVDSTPDGNIALAVAVE